LRLLSPDRLDRDQAAEMVRVLALAALMVVLVVVLRAVVAAFVAGMRGGGVGRDGARRRALRDDLVKDPVCDTYVPRRSATTRMAGSVTHYFCSSDCARKFES
jgi:YHS domain-containing protein